MNEFPEDFYGSELKIVMLGYIRPMTSFKSLGNLFLYHFQLIKYLC